MQRNQLRIIGGRYRSRKLHFPNSKGLRPTGDRIRETLFNWLAATVEGARCLDLFAGSGSLGLEALSRGASFVQFIDSSTLVCDQLQKNLELLQANNTDSSKSQVNCSNARQALQEQTTTFDIVFLDPPFETDLLSSTCQQLEQANLLNPGSFIYVETAKKTHNQFIPPENWRLHQDKESGNVRYQLYQRA